MKTARCFLYMALFFAFMFSAFELAGLRINPTPSLPKGVYRITPHHGSRNLVKGDLIGFCLRGEFADLAKSAATFRPVPAKTGCGLCSNAWRVCRAIT